MVRAFPVSLLVAALLGYLSGLGVGGGSLLMLWLTAAVHLPQEEARLLNLMFFVPAALLSQLVRGKQQRPPLPALLPAVLAGSLGALMGSYLAGAAETALLKKAFGLLLLVTGIRELLKK